MKPASWRLNQTVSTSAHQAMSDVSDQPQFLLASQYCAALHPNTSSQYLLNIWCRWNSRQQISIRLATGPLSQRDPIKLSKRSHFRSHLRADLHMMYISERTHAHLHVRCPPSPSSCSFISLWWEPRLILFLSMSDTSPMQSCLTRLTSNLICGLGDFLGICWPVLAVFMYFTTSIVLLLLFLLLLLHSQSKPQIIFSSLSALVFGHRLMHAVLSDSFLNNLFGIAERASCAWLPWEDICARTAKWSCCLKNCVASRFAPAVLFWNTRTGLNSSVLHSCMGLLKLCFVY